MMAMITMMRIAMKRWSRMRMCEKMRISGMREEGQEEDYETDAEDKNWVEEEEYDTHHDDEDHGEEEDD